MKRSRNRAGLLLYILVTLITGQSAHAAGVVLWNKLGSDSEVLNSEIGPGGTIIGGDYAFEPAQFGNGYVRKATGDNYISFPSSLVDQLTHRGTIALWINPKVQHPVPYDYGVFGLVGTPYGWAFLPSDPGWNILLSWGDGVSSLGISGGLNFGSTPTYTPAEPTQFVATSGVPFHVAMSWDIDGIDGTADTIRVYRDGQLIGSTTDAWDPNGTRRDVIVLGYGPDSNGFDKFITDNLVIYDFAKTDFSDRFLESSLGPVNVGGSVTGIIPETVDCLNETTGQNVEVTLDGNTSWNCEAEGLLVDPGDRIMMTVGGTVPRVGDINTDGCIDRTDANILLEYVRNSGPYYADYDLNDDGSVNIADVRTLVLLFDNPGGAPCD